MGTPGEGREMGMGIPGEGKGYTREWDMEHGYIWQASSTHPTGMPSCSLHNFTNCR